VYIVITGNGTGANAFATINVTTSQIGTVVIDDPGTDYTYANVMFYSVSGQDAGARAIISPPGGHGSDPLRELGGSYLIINPRLEDDEDGILPVTNDYRQIGIIQDPRLRGNTTISTNTAVKQYITLTLNGTSLTDYVQDEQVYQSTVFGSATFTGTVLEFASSTIKLINTTGIPSLDLLTGATSTASKFVDSITYPDLEKYSGHLLYLDNIKPIQRSSDQTEDFKIILSF
jgi:hypothetical protein